MNLPSFLVVYQSMYTPIRSTHSVCLGAICAEASAGAPPQQCEVPRRAQLGLPSKSKAYITASSVLARRVLACQLPPTGRARRGSAGERVANALIASHAGPGLDFGRARPSPTGGGSLPSPRQRREDRRHQGAPPPPPPPPARGGLRRSRSPGGRSPGVLLLPPPGW